MNNIADYKKLTPEILQEYIILDIWTLEEYIALLLQLNPEHFPNLKKLINTPQGEKLYKLIIKGINADILPCKITRNLYGSQPPLYEFTPLDAVMFATKKGILLFEGMEELAKKHHAPEAEGLEEKCPKCYDELERLRKKISDLEKSLSTPHHKRAVSLHKGFIGALSSKYGRDKILTSFDENLVLNSDDKKSKIEIARIIRDFDSQGINLDDQTIKGLIKDSIDYLK